MVSFISDGNRNHFSQEAVTEQYFPQSLRGETGAAGSPIPRSENIVSTSVLTVNVSTVDQINITAQAEPLSVVAPVGIPLGGQRLMIRIKDNGTPRPITWSSVFRAFVLTLPDFTVSGKVTYVGMLYNETDSKWDVLATSRET